MHGAALVREQLAEWFATPCRLEELRPTALPTGELVEFLRTWDEPTGPAAVYQVHILQVQHGRIASDRVWCGGKWSAAQLAEMAAAEDRRRADF